MTTTYQVVEIDGKRLVLPLRRGKLVTFALKHYGPVTARMVLKADFKAVLRMIDNLCVSPAFREELE